jgi:hypothetical protein
LVTARPGRGARWRGSHRVAATQRGSRPRQPRAP